MWGDPSGYIEPVHDAGGIVMYTVGSAEEARRAVASGTDVVVVHFASGESIVRHEPAPPMAGTTGEIEALSMWAGQSVALARQPQSAAEIVTELTSRL